MNDYFSGYTLEVIMVSGILSFFSISINLSISFVVAHIEII